MFEGRIKDALNLALRQSLKDPRLTMVSITRVELTNDYSQAKVYWDSFNAENRGDLKKAVSGASSKLRSVLAKELNVRHTPELFLYFDSQFEDERKIEELLKGNQDNSEES